MNLVRALSRPKCPPKDTHPNDLRCHSEFGRNVGDRGSRARKTEELDSIREAGNREAHLKNHYSSKTDLIKPDLIGVHDTENRKKRRWAEVFVPVEVKANDKEGESDRLSNVSMVC